MPFKKYSITILLACLGSFACKKEPTTWENRIETPLLKGELGINGLLPAEDLNANASKKLTLVRVDTLFELALDSILKLPDTTLEKSYSAPFGGTTVSPGQSLTSSSQTRTLQVPKAELSRVVMEKGKLRYKVKSTIGERTLYNYRIPAATKNGQPLEVYASVPAGSLSDPSTVKGVKDLKGYSFDLTGPNGGKTNHFRTETQVRTDPEGSDIALETSDNVIIKNSFEGLRPEFAKGYFGQHSFDRPYSESRLGLFDKVRSGSIDIDSVRVELTIDNGIGMDARMTIPKLRASGGNDNVDLSHSMIGAPINISRAAYKNATMDHTVHQEIFTPQNSNVDAFLEALPQRIGHELELMTNPMGDISSGNDILMDGHSVHGRMRMILPLSFTANELTLADTMDWNFNTEGRNGKIEEGTFFLNVDNGFPMALELSLHLHREDGTRTSTLFDERSVAAAPTNASWKVIRERQKKIRISVPESKMVKIRNAEKAIVVARFNSPAGAPAIDIYEDHGIDLQLTGDFRYQNSLE